jgi:hypothetical protein
MKFTIRTKNNEILKYFYGNQTPQAAYRGRNVSNSHSPRSLSEVNIQCREVEFSAKGD